MKHIIRSAAFIGIMTCALSAPTGYAAGRRLENVQPKFALIGSPEIMASVKGSQPKRARVLSAGEPAPIWLEFETDFDANDEFPELTVKCSLLLAIGQRLKLAEGEVTLVDVAKGKDRHAVMYIAPKTLNRIAENKPFTVNMVKAIWVEMVSQGETQGGQFKSGSGVTYEQVAKQKEQLDKVSDAMLNKNQTPFAPLYWDYYEATKTGR